jgi:hypothetical protein
MQEVVLGFIDVSHAHFAEKKSFNLQKNASTAANNLNNPTIKQDRNQGNADRQRQELSRSTRPHRPCVGGANG